MSTSISWQEIALRLFVTVVAGAIIGLNREEQGRSAGLRTTMLVCLAASVSMIQMNLLLGATGKAPDSFVVMDVMRLPLGILSGIGFIGAGAILRKGSLVTGVTTAATLWFTTVMGLCIGGGQIGLGLAALVLAFFILWSLKKVERLWHREQSGTLTLDFDRRKVAPEEIARRIIAEGGKIRKLRGTVITDEGKLEHQTAKVCLENRASKDKPPAFVQSLAGLPGMVSVEWREID